MQLAQIDYPNTSHHRIVPSRRPQIRRDWLYILLCSLLMLSTMLAPRPAWSDGEEEAEVWLQVDTQALILRVMRGQQPIRTYEDIAIGRFGTTADKRHLDGKTPLGEYHISVIKNKSLYHRFFGFDYPLMDQAERALKRGDLPLDEYQAINSAVRAHRTPPQNTALGGHLGIHGIGAGDPKVHQAYNWTNGCIALTNLQVDELAQWVRLGVRVVIY